MDYLHINAIIKEVYSDAKCGCAFPEVYKNNLHKHVANDEFLKNSAIDSVLTYFSMKEQDRAPLLVLANVERQKTCESVGRAVQCLGWEWDGKLIRSDMDTIFEAGFYGEKEYVEMMEESVTIPLPARSREPGFNCGIEISHKVKKAIMTAVFLRWIRRDNPIRIAVPRDVDYNSYVWQAVEKIYALFPVALRVEAGFCSYMPDISKASSRVYLGFIPEDMADAKTMFLDGSRQSAVTAMEKGTQRKHLDQFIDFVCGIDDPTRKNFLEEVYEDLEGAGDPKVLQGVNPKDYQPYGEAAALLMQRAPLEQMLPLWDAFYQNKDKQTPRMYARVIDRIHQQLNPEEFCQQLRNACVGKKSLKDIVDVFLGYKSFYEDNSLLAETAWNSMLALLRETGASEKGIYDEIFLRRKKMGSLLNAQRLDNLHRLTILEALAALQKQKTETAEDVNVLIGKATELGKTISAVPESAHTESLMKALQEYQDELIRKQNEFTAQRLHGEFEKLQKAPAEKLAEIQKVIRSGQKLIDTIDQEPNIQIFADLKLEVLSYIAHLEEKNNASSTKYAHIQSIIRSRKNYFAILEDLQVADRAFLEGEQVQVMAEELKSVRPKTIKDYQNRFEDHYHKPLTLKTVSSLADFVCRTVVQDICDFSTLQVAYSKTDDAMGNLNAVCGAGFAAKKISGRHVVRVEFQGMEWDGKWFEQMLKLTHTTQTMGSQEQFEQVFFALVDSGAYHGAELLKCIQMFNACEQKYMELFKRIMAGRFAKCTESQYLAALEMIAEYSNEKRIDTILQKMQNKCKELDYLDSDAQKAFQKFQKKNKADRAGMRPKAMLVALIITSVAALVLAAALVIVFVSGKQQEQPEETTIPTQQTMPVETEASEIVCCDLHEMLARDSEAVEKLFAANAAHGFDTYADLVSETFQNLDEAQKQSVVEQYLSDETHMVIDDNTQVAWDEFYFWACWNYAMDVESNPARDFSLEEYREEAYALLRVIHQTMPGQSETPEIWSTSTTESTEDPTDSTDEVTGETVSKSEEVNSTTELVRPSMTEVMEKICAAARDNYLAAEGNAQQLKLILALFGADFSKDFVQHRKNVEDLLAADDSRAAEQMMRYQSLPGDTEVRFMDNGVTVSWNEYMFWECWVQANFGNEVAGEEDSLNAMVLEVLTLIYEMPHTDMQLMAEDDAVPAASMETTLPTDTSTATDSTASTEAADFSEPGGGTTPGLSTEPEQLVQLGFQTIAAEVQASYEFAAKAYQTVTCAIVSG